MTVYNLNKILPQGAGDLHSETGTFIPL